MKRLQEIRQTAQDTEYLIKQMKEEMDDLRYMVYRYHLMYGERVKGGDLTETPLPDTTSFRFDKGNDDSCIVKMTHHEGIRIKSTYMKIVETINTLI